MTTKSPESIHVTPAGRMPLVLLLVLVLVARVASEKWKVAREEESG